MEFLINKIRKTLEKGSVELDQSPGLRHLLGKIFYEDTLRLGVDNASGQFAEDYILSNPVPIEFLRQAQKNEMYIEWENEKGILLSRETDHYSSVMFTREPITGRLALAGFNPSQQKEFSSMSSGFLKLAVAIQWALANVPQELLEKSDFSMGLKPKGGSRDYSSSIKMSYIHVRNIRKEADGSYSAEDASGVRYHHVRSHTRHLTDDRTTTVREYWKGDKSKGVIHQLYVARRAPEGST